MKFIFLSILSFAISTKLFAQYKDAEVWENVAFEKKFSQQWDAHFNHEGRITNNDSQFHYAYGDIGVSYRLITWQKHKGEIAFSLKLTGDYVFLWKYDELITTIRHQWYFDYLAKIKFYSFEFEWRNMYQQEVNNVYSSEFGYIPDNYFRNKFTLEHRFHKHPWYRIIPYIASEIYYHTDKDDSYGPQIDRIRYFAGGFYYFNKKTSLELYYLYENNFNINNPDKNYVMGIGFAREL
jgi:Protein of unknown function (DUF2490)